MEKMNMEGIIIGLLHIFFGGLLLMVASLHEWYAPLVLVGISLPIIGILYIKDSV